MSFPSLFASLPLAGWSQLGHPSGSVGPAVRQGEGLERDSAGALPPRGDRPRVRERALAGEVRSSGLNLSSLAFQPQFSCQ